MMCNSLGGWQADTDYWGLYGGSCGQYPPASPYIQSSAGWSAGSWNQLNGQWNNSWNPQTDQTIGHSPEMRGVPGPQQTTNRTHHRRNSSLESFLTDMRVPNGGVDAPAHPARKKRPSSKKRRGHRRQWSVSSHESKHSESSDDSRQSLSRTSSRGQGQLIDSLAKTAEVPVPVSSASRQEKHEPRQVCVRIQVHGYLMERGQVPDVREGRGSRRHRRRHSGDLPDMSALVLPLPLPAQSKALSARTAAAAEAEDSCGGIYTCRNN